MAVAFFFGTFYKEICLYFLGITNVEYLFQLFSVICVKPLFLYRLSTHVPHLSRRIDLTRELHTLILVEVFSLLPDVIKFRGSMA